MTVKNSFYGPDSVAERTRARQQVQDEPSAHRYGNQADTEPRHAKNYRLAKKFLPDRLIPVYTASFMAIVNASFYGFRFWYRPKSNRVAFP